ncbi:MAG: chemotaxis protein CheD [bacterium]|nr:chemotaxis protein CheD [bacterium]
MDLQIKEDSSPNTEQHYIGIAQMKICNKQTEILIAPNLGSCLGVTVWDRVKMIGGMIHCLLPLSKSDPQKASQNPCMYVDTGVAFLIEEILAAGSKKSDLIITAAGGSNINDKNNVFEIGKKNHTVFRKIMWKNNLLIKGEDTGSDHARTLKLIIATGEVTVKGASEVKKLF